MHYLLSSGNATKYNYGLTCTILHKILCNYLKYVKLGKIRTISDPKAHKQEFMNIKLVCTKLLTKTTEFEYKFIFYSSLAINKLKHWHLVHDVCQILEQH